MPILYLQMLKKQLCFLYLTFLVSCTANVQTYEKQHEKYSQPLQKLETVDSIYFSLVHIRDSSLRGFIAPNFVVSTIDNKVIELSKLKGQVVFLNFWFTQCQPCIEEMKYLNQLAELYSSKKIVFISFANDDTHILKQFISQHPFKFKLISNGDSIRKDVFKLMGLWPQNVIIDQEGKIVKMGLDLGPVTENTFQNFQKLIDNLLK